MSQFSLCREGVTNLRRPVRSSLERRRQIETKLRPTGFDSGDVGGVLTDQHIDTEEEPGRVAAERPVVVGDLGGRAPAIQRRSNCMTTRLPVQGETSQIERAAQPAAMADPHRTGQRHLRIPRGLPQPPPTSLRLGNAHPDRIRENPPRQPNPSTPESSKLTPPNPGNIRASKKPGAVHRNEALVLSARMGYGSVSI